MGYVPSLKNLFLVESTWEYTERKISNKKGAAVWPKDS